jgi:hypothetical protein
MLCDPTTRSSLFAQPTYFYPGPRTIFNLKSINHEMITRAKAILGLARAAPVASKPKVVHLADTADTTNTTETTTPTPKLPIEEIFRFPVVVSCYRIISDKIVEVKAF